MARELVVRIVGDSRSLEKALDKSAKSAKKFNTGVEKTGKRGRSMFSGLAKGAGLLTGALGAAGLVGAAKAAFGEMADAQKVAAQTEAVLKSTGGAANVTAKQVDDLSTSLMNMSGVDDEAIKSGENLLLTFTNVRNEVGKGNDVFDQATKTMLDMSVALGQDMKSSAIQLGKALNDPTKGIGALTRVGVTFTASQKRMIKSLDASGDKLGAQKLILQELQKEFGGSAKAAGETLPGKLNILRETVLNLAGQIAEKLSPAITRVVERLTKWMQNSKNQKTVMDTVQAVVATLTTAINILKKAFEFLNKITGSTTNTIKLLIAALIVLKGLQLASAAMGMARSIGLIGTQAGVARGRVIGLSRALRLLSGIGIITLGIEVLLNRKKIDRAVENFLDEKGFGFVTGGDFTGKSRAELQKIAAAGGIGGQAAGKLLQRPEYRGARPQVAIAGGIHLHGVQNVRQLESELTRRTQSRAHTRRGP